MPFKLPISFGRLACGLALAFCCAMALAQSDDSAALVEDEALLSQLQGKVAQPLPEGASRRERCVYFQQRGLANSRLGHYAPAVEDLRHALSLNEKGQRSNGDECNRWRLQNDLSNVLQANGDHFGRIQHLQAVAAEWRKSNPRYYFLAQLFLIDPYVTLGMLNEAEAAFQNATKVLPELRARRDWGSYQHNLMDFHSRYAAWLQELRGNYVEGERLRRAALAHAREFLADRVNRFEAGSTPVLLAEGNVTNTLRQLANNLTAQGKLGEAEYLARTALGQVLARASLQSAGASNALTALGSVELQQGRLDAAARYFELAIKAVEGRVLPYSTSLASKRADLGLVWAMQGQWPAVIQLFEQRDKDLRGNPAQFAKYGSNHLEWALALLRTGQTRKAVGMLQRQLAFTLRKPFVDPLNVAHRRGYLAAALAAEGDDAEALSEFQAALPVLLKRAHEDAGNEDAGFVRVFRLRVILEAYLELLAKRYGAGEEWAAAEAFMIADVARSSSVQRAVTASAARAVLPDPQLADLARREQDAANRAHALNRIVARLASAAEGQRLQTVIADMQQDVERLTAEQARLRQEISERYPEYAELVDPRPAALADVQRSLKAEEALVAFYCGERQAYVWGLDRSRMSFRVVPLDRAQLAQAVADVRQGVDLHDSGLKPYDLAAAHRLYASLLAPDQALWSSAKLLNVVPHGPLGQLPFAALLTAPTEDKGRYGAMPWLIKKVAIAQQSSASGFLALRRAAVAAGERRPFVGFGDPLFVAREAADSRASQFRNLQVKAVKDAAAALVDQAQQTAQPLADAAPPRPGLNQAFALLPQLPDTADELREIASTIGANQKRELFLGARATEGNLKSTDLSRYRVVAFATHGLVPGELSGLDQPALALANPQLTGDANNDGLLMLDEVLGLKLNADWVVLSACNTASADGNAGEAVSGLGRGFFYAGARSLLVSNWAVESRSARLLTTGLFRLQAANPAMNRAEALRRSMLDLMARGNEYDHPVFWAPFSLVGEGLRQ